MRKPLQVGITGGIGSGKSLVCRIFQCLGISVYDADSRAKSLMTTDGILVSQIRKEFGDLAFNPDGSINREYLAENVFNRPDRLSKLNSLVHPRVGEDYKRWLDMHMLEPFVIKEAAIMIETGSHHSLDHIIVVSAPESLRIKRVLHRDPQRTTQDIRAIIRNQMSEEKKLQHADDVIVNDETVMIIPQVLNLYNKLSGGA